MSSHFHVYVGPHLEVPQVPKTVETHEYLCQGESCGKSYGSERTVNFCSHCGGRVACVVVRARELRYPRCHQLGEAWEDFMWSPESLDHIWIPNRKGFGTTYSRWSPESPMTLTSESIAEDFRRFTEAHQGLIAAFKEMYGVEPKPNYGVVPYYS